MATGDNYSEPATNTSDAVLAIDLKTGKLLWSTQLTSDDVFNNSCGTPQRTNCQHPAGPDYGFGQSPILVGLSGTKRALVVAQKSGMVYALIRIGRERSFGRPEPVKGVHSGGASGVRHLTDRTCMSRSPIKE